MKRFANGRSRLLSLVLSLVLVVGLMPVICLPGYAANFSTKTAGNFQYYSSGCLKSIDVTIQAASGSYALAYGRIAVHKSKTSYGWENRYATAGNSWPTSITDITVCALSNDAEFVWTDCNEHKVTVSFADNKVPMTAGKTYYIYLWTRSPDFGVYPDALIGSFTVKENGDVESSDMEIADPPVLPHTHSWNSLTSGLGTKQASTTISCDDLACGKGIKVSLTASDVTLPGNAFSAKIDVEEIQKEVVAAAYSPRALSFAAPQLSTRHGLTVSDEPGYKYSPDGNNFTEIDPKTFTPVPGFYQASILVKDGDDTVENLYVNYTVSDPAVTAATGDNRPIELMVMGMAFFSVLAIAAFVLDSKRRGNC